MTTATLAPERIPDEIAIKAVDPKAYADNSVYDAFKWLRANNPLGRAELEGVKPFWIVTRHADILEISRQNDLFHSGDQATTFTTLEGDRLVRQMTGGSPHLVRTLVQMDAPDHPKYRVMTQAWFLPQNIRKLEDRIREIARQHVDRMAELGGQCDFVNEIALYYPLRVIMEILGVPPEDEPRMLRLTQELFGAQDPELNRGRQEMMDNKDAMAQMQGVIADFFMYFKGITDARKAEPQGDLASVIANGKLDGEPINDFEAMSYYVIVATAGHDTTSSSTAGAIWGLAQNPDQFAKVKADPSLIPGLVDEAIRWTTPVKHFMRSATEDTEIGGRKIAKGDWLWLAYPSGNRDEEVFEDPDAFRADRTSGKHLAFGYGAHVCLGQHLAKMEMRILFEELLPRLKSLELAGEPRMSQANFVSGPKTLPIKYEMS
ncbi:cytochrome P450 [Caulobacter ginsengisoli]|uniref:Cytochrome P450 n=1 Tax=Caulobacter ginsengisoli TaxID=400775 RepID=A0ABU0ISB1_9CAUL|nr:cytochrome P450 [Caulobacter ginsengisoli]MDQ0464898.1 cytochrome P450 [Caulobacter ginsengisoli]